MSEQQALVDALVELGVSADEAQRAVAEDRVPLVLVSQMGRPSGPYSLAEVAERAGVPLEVLRERYRVLGISEHAGFGDDDVEEARNLARMLAVMPPGSLIRVIRTDAQALQRVALAHLELAREQFVTPVRDAGGDDVTVALSLAEAHRALRGAAGDLVGASYEHVFDQLLSSELIAAATREGGDQVTLAVGFADVVGYTSLSARIDPQGLGEVIEAFESRCFTVAGTAEVQLVKFLGDAAMFVSTDAITLAKALLQVVEEADDDSPLAGTPISAGMAHGPVTMRGGDYYGPMVNLAARLTDRSRGGRLLADEDLRELLGEAFALHRMAPMPLRGCGIRRPVSVRPAG